METNVRGRVSDDGETTAAWDLSVHGPLLTHRHVPVSCACAGFRNGHGHLFLESL